MPSQFFRKDGPINPRAPVPNLPSVAHLIESTRPSHVGISTFNNIPSSSHLTSKHLSIPKSEMTQAQRHTAHLHKKRTQRKNKKRDEGELIKMAVKGDKRALRIVEGRRANKILHENRNVSFIQSDKKRSSDGKSYKRE